MQIKYTMSSLKGYKRVERVVYNSSMISEEARRRKRILDFWRKYGLEAAQEAFGISRRTLYRRRAKLNDSKGDLSALNPRSRRPKRVHKSKVYI